MSVPRGLLSGSSPTKEKTSSPMLMNIYVTDNSPQVSARNLDNRLLEQQIVFVACLLSKYAKECSYGINGLHRHIHSNNPYMRWCWNSSANMDWLMDYGVCLVVEYGLRHKKPHAGSKHIFDFVNEFGTPVGAEPLGFLNRAFNDVFDFRWRTPVTQAYKDYLNAIWTTSTRKLSWGERMPPAWWIDMQIIRGAVKENIPVQQPKYIESDLFKRMMETAENYANDVKGVGA